jgi:hypothetical protein
VILKRPWSCFVHSAIAHTFYTGLCDIKLSMARDFSCVLPPELWYAICDTVQQQPNLSLDFGGEFPVAPVEEPELIGLGADPEARATLKNLSLTCHILSKVSQPLLFSDLHIAEPLGRIESLNATDVVDEASQANLQLKAEVDRVTERLNFCAQSRICSHVRSLRMHLPSTLITPQSKATLPQWQTMEYIIALALSKRPLFSRLALVEIRHLDIGKRMSALICSGGPIDHLHLINCDHETTDSIIAPFTVKHLTVKEDSPYKIFQFVLSGLMPKSSLRQITVPHVSTGQLVELLCQHLSVLSSVTSLRLVAKVHERGTKAVELILAEIEQLVTLLAACSSLEELHIGPNQTRRAQSPLPRESLPTLKVLCCGMHDLEFFSSAHNVRDLHVALPRFLVNTHPDMTPITLVNIMVRNVSFFSRLDTLSIALTGRQGIHRLFMCLKKTCPRLRTLSILCFQPDIEVRWSGPCYQI